MFVPNTREPQKIPGSQITRGLQVGCSRSSLSDHRGACCELFGESFS